MQKNFGLILSETSKDHNFCSGYQVFIFSHAHELTPKRNLCRHTLEQTTAIDGQKKGLENQIAACEAAVPNQIAAVASHLREHNQIGVASHLRCDETRASRCLAKPGCHDEPPHVDEATRCRTIANQIDDEGTFWREIPITAAPATTQPPATKKAAWRRREHTYIARILHLRSKQNRRPPWQKSMSIAPMRQPPRYLQKTRPDRPPRSNWWVIIFFYSTSLCAPIRQLISA